jgi:hypothetical protein
MATLNIFSLQLKPSKIISFLSFLFLISFFCKIYPIKKKVDGDQLQILIILPLLFLSHIENEI